MSRRPVLLTSLALAVAGGVSSLAATRTGNFGGASDLIWLASFASFALVGALVLQHHPGHLVGALFVAAGLGTHVAVMLDELGILYDSAGLRTLSVMTFAVTWMLATAFALLFYPDGALPSRRWRPLVAAEVAVTGLVCAAVVVDPKPFEPGGGRSPMAVDALGSVPSQVATGCLLASAVVTLAALSSLVLRWRRADGPARRQLAWLALGALVVILLTVLSWAAYGTVHDLPPWVGAVFEAVQIAAIPAVTYVAMVRHRLFDVETALRRSLVYVVLTGLVLLTYAATLAAASRAVGAEAGVGASLVAGAVVAVLLVPVKTVLDRGVERLLFGDRRRPEAALAAVGAQLNRAERPADVLPAAAESIRAALRLRSVTIHLDGAETPTACAGAQGEVAARVEMTAFGRREGVLLVGLHGPGDRLRPKDLALIEQLGQQVALLARSVRLTESLQTSRERLVAARETERRRLRRDLHDGVGPVLAGLTLQVDALRGYLDQDQHEGASLAQSMKSELRRAIAALRHALEGLRPEDLDQLGLAGVLAEHARSLAATGILRVEVDCPDDLRVAAASEVAAYRIVTEAMTNAVRHAEATSLRVAVSAEGDRLRLRIEDDGRGVPDGHDEGVGLVSMRERAEELGGTCLVRPGPDGGTVVSAELPLGDPA